MSVHSFDLPHHRSRELHLRLRQYDSVADSLSRWFAAEIIGNVLDIEPRRWRRPRKIEFRQNKDRVKKFKQKYDKFDWTGMIERS